MDEIKNFEELAEYLEDVYGVQYDVEEGFFCCPECGEPIYFMDWDFEEMHYQCPVCEFSWGEE